MAGRKQSTIDDRIKKAETVLVKVNNPGGFTPSVRWQETVSTHS